MVAIPASEVHGQSIQSRREAVVTRLMERGIPVRALEALLPGWEIAIAAVMEDQALGDHSVA